MRSNCGLCNGILVFTVVALVASVASADNGIRTVILADDQAPGTPTGAVFSGFGGPTLNSTGQVAFKARLEIGLGGVDNTNNSGI